MVACLSVSSSCVFGHLCALCVSPPPPLARVRFYIYKQERSLGAELHSKKSSLKERAGSLVCSLGHRVVDSCEGQERGQQVCAACVPHDPTVTAVKVFLEVNLVLSLQSSRLRW